MSVAIIYSRASAGIQAPIVTVEAHISNGLPSFSIVGLPNTAVKESKERVRSAILNAQFEFPLRRITVNLAPADLPKDGGRFDLAIAVSILAASMQLPAQELAQYEFAGELALSGNLRSIPGILPFALQTKNSQRQLILSEENIEEATLVQDLTLLPAKHLLEVAAHLTRQQLITPYTGSIFIPELHMPADLAEVHGQSQARRTLEIAASGGHSLLMSGPPGTGKSMLASRLPGILPILSEEEALEVAAVASISSQGFKRNHWKTRPFRAPHHTASCAALVGGGNPPRPGEISLAHHGVLFLDELPEFSHKVLDTLREPLETGMITISRAARQAEFPAGFQLIAAMNPCPCGHLSDPQGDCHCTPDQIKRYCAKISGPLLDRIDMHIEVSRLPHGSLSLYNSTPSESSSIVRERVQQTRQIQLVRANKPNARLTNAEIQQFCRLSKKDQKLLDEAAQKLNISARGYYRVLRVARTIADIHHCEFIKTEHLTEALNYRRRF